MTNVHSADGSFLGFLFQIERVLLWLSEGGDGKKVGIETDDDIVVQIQNGKEIQTIYEQAKNAQSSKLPFSNQSEDLWKTLSIWVKAVENGNVDVTTAIFSAITNKQLPKNRLLLKLSSTVKENTAEMSAIIKELKETALKLGTSTRIFGDVILNCDESVLASIIDKIIVLDGTFHHDQRAFKKQLRANLSISNKLPFDHIYHTLLGSVADRIIDCWRKKEEAWITVDSFNNLYNDLIAEYQKKSFLEKATELLPLNKYEIEHNRKSIYVEQLKAINCEDKEVLEAIYDYLRAKSEKSRYAKEFEVTESKFIMYYEDLKQHWVKISRPKYKINPQNLKLVDVGYQVYYETILYKGKLNNQEPEQSYTYKGAYHHLANESELGWHPNWELIFNKSKDADHK